MGLAAPERLRWLADLFDAEQEQWPGFEHAIVTGDAPADLEAAAARFLDAHPDAITLPRSGRVPVIAQQGKPTTHVVRRYRYHCFWGSDARDASAAFFCLARHVFPIGDNPDQTARAILRSYAEVWWLEETYESLFRRQSDRVFVESAHGVAIVRAPAGLFEASAAALRCLDDQNVEASAPVLRNEDRDRYCYQTARDNPLMPWKQVAALASKRPEWEPVDGESARMAAKRFAERNNLPRVRRKR